MWSDFRALLKLPSPSWPQTIGMPKLEDTFNADFLFIGDFHFSCGFLGSSLSYLFLYRSWFFCLSVCLSVYLSIYLFILYFSFQSLLLFYLSLKYCFLEFCPQPSSILSLVLIQTRDFTNCVWWLPNLCLYPRALSYLTDFHLKLLSWHFCHVLPGDSNQYIKIKRYHFPSYYPYSFLSLVLANNLRCQTINLRVPLTLLSLSPLVPRHLQSCLLCPSLSSPLSLLTSRTCHV